MIIDLKCRLCDKVFDNIRELTLHIVISHKMLSKDYYDQFYKTETDGKCETCGKPTKFYRISQGGYYRFCSKKCSAQSESTKARKKETNDILYGGIGFASKELSNKVKNVCKEKYGVEYASQSKTFKDKVKENSLKKYGVESVNQCDWKINKGKEKYNLTMTTQYGNEYKQLYPEIISYNNNMLICHCNKCNNTYNISKQTFLRRKKLDADTCLYCNPISNHFSFAEKQIYEFIKSIYDGEIIENDKTVLDSKELDIYIPAKKLALEYDGLYWHSELYKDNNYHIDKTTECLAKGIQLIHIFEDEWIYKQDIVKSRLKGLLGLNNHIFARKCTVMEVPYKESEEFLNTNHIQGNCMSSYRYGLYYNNELVSLMTFGQSRFKSNEYELLRFCNKLNTNVIGGASRLFKHFLDEHIEIKEIISFADRRWSKGNLYEKLGFKLDSITKPSYYYINEDIRENRINYQKHKLVKEGYSPELTEHEIMLQRGIYRIYDCGNLKYRFTDD